MSNPWITSINPPKYKVGRYSLNEYELRCLMLETRKGNVKPGLMVKDQYGTVAEIYPNGRLSQSLYGMDISSMFTLEQIRLNRIEKQNT